MKRFIVILIVLLGICAAFFYALSWPRGLGDKRAAYGVMDLIGADFSQTRYNLEGEWEFFGCVLN